MPSRGRARGFIFCSYMLGWLLVVGTAWATPGTVLSYQKISDTQGNFTAPLTNLSELGGAAVGLGDLDGAGPSVAAMAVGSAFDDDGGTDRGAVFIMFMDATGNVLSYQKISNTQGNFAEPLLNLDEFGSSVAYLGDLDGAGPSVAALAVGAVGEDDGGLDRGCVYILFLSSTGNVLSYSKISDTVGNLVSPLDNLDEFGGAVAGLGDLDGAGPSRAALSVGAAGDDDGGTDRGAVYILFLSSAGAVLSEQKISDTQGNFTAVIDNLDNFGSSVASLGDLDGGGPSVQAVAAGAAFDDDGGIDRGAVYIMFLNSAGSVLSYQKISDTQGNFLDFFSDLDEFGGAVQNLGDLDGTGGSVTSLAVGVAGDDDGGEDRGAVHILFLNATGTCIGSQKISDFYGNFTPVMHDFDAFGSSVAFVGDLDGAGPSRATMVVGMTGDDDGGTDRGAVYVLFLDGVLNQYTLTYTAGPNGTITGTTPQTVNQGASGTQVTAVPNAAYHFLSWSDGVLTASRTETNVSANLSVTANFAINTFTLTYTAGPNGTITGTTPQTVNQGASGTQVTAVPNAGYQFVSWSDGVLTASRTETNVSANLSVTANFAINTFTLTYTAGPNGTITGTTPQTVSQGGSGTQVTAVPNAGYQFVSWSDGVLTASRTETNVSANLSVTATFAIKTYTLTYTAVPNGTITGTSPQTVSHGGSGTQVTAVPNAGYQFVSWSDGVLTASRTDTTVTANVSVTANFAIVVGVSPLPRPAFENALGRAWPNPFHPRTTIPFRLKEEADVRIDIWDLDGRLVRQLVREQIPAGEHQAEWDGRDDAGRALSNGTYFYRMAINGRLVKGVGKALLLR